MASHAIILIGPVPPATSYQMLQKLETLNQLAPRPKRGRPSNKDKKMTPTAIETQTATMTVFDLKTFDDVKLTLDVPLPAKPTTLEEALAAVGNDSQKLLDVIHEGLAADAIVQAKKNPHQFFVVEDGTQTTKLYDGTFADEAKGKLINNAILALAKMNGFEKSLDPKKKAELKERATQFLRENPSMLSNILPAVPVAPANPEALTEQTATN